MNLCFAQSLLEIPQGRHKGAKTQSLIFSIGCVIIFGATSEVFIREMPKTLEDVADLVSYICALDKG
ncbi:MAG: hypothetical protein AN482_10460 [Anabaena sp. LE011-02]|jgi:hypothetical protein|nr:MAG: hypothetical protein AN482_10460 [Anabaena sp. LE011-02]OBQ38965.1 MAG: hypothetical protein AN485_06875 [Anabaena sp. MDT14b]